MKFLPKSRTKRAISGTALILLVNKVLMLLTTVVLARMLGVANYGVYAFVMAAIALVGLPTNAGLPNLLIRETAITVHRKDWGRFRGLLTAANVGIGVISLVSAILAYGAFVIHGGSSETVMRALAWGLVLVPLLALGNTRGAILKGLGHAVQGQLPEMIIRPLLLVIMVWAAALLSLPMSPVTVLQANLVAAALAFGAGAVMLYRFTPRETWNRPAGYALREWGASLGPMSLFSLLTALNAEIGILLIGYAGTSADVGIYRVASQSALVLGIGNRLAHTVLGPLFSKHYVLGEKDQIRRLAKRSAVMLVALALPIALVLVAFGRPLLAFLYGIEFGDGAVALAVMAVGQVVTLSFGSVALLLNMTGFERKTLAASYVAILVNVGLGLVLIPSFGATGAAIASVSSSVLWNITLLRGALTGPRINPSIFPLCTTEDR